MLSRVLSAASVGGWQHDRALSSTTTGSSHRVPFETVSLAQVNRIDAPPYFEAHECYGGRIVAPTAPSSRLTSIELARSVPATTYRQLSSALPLREAMPLNSLFLPPLCRSRDSPVLRPPMPPTPIALPALASLWATSESVSDLYTSPSKSSTPIAKPMTPIATDERDQPSTEPATASTSAAASGSAATSTSKRKRGRRSRDQASSSTAAAEPARCDHCGTTDSPLWRKGPQGMTLCK